ncbi:hypothetical protein B0T24DRAFT_718227 [Lasiosphaeria ovina]|uniref:Uncharacterized protein n=1 Tax=Lasiosphaeria ovina TaxID=92902 RepID=A0AAE0N9F8_9PEZI|nr:hypothetical protein B0T24DRAFT_718227 [Lasiosphaeria ovina]
MANFRTLFIFTVSAMYALVSADGINSNIGKRSLLQSRQRCITPGWIPVCGGALPCIPPGAICCSPGESFAVPPRSCPSGTHPYTTAPGGSVVTTPAPTLPATTATVVDYTWYTFTITWYYWYYYYTYTVIDAAATTVLASTQITSVTAVSVTASDSAAANASVAAYTVTAAFPTPTQAVTSVSGSLVATPAGAPPAVDFGGVDGGEYD